MQLSQITSEFVRSRLTGSFTPASDILAAMDDNKLDIVAQNEALDYFAPYGGLQAAARAEHNFCVRFDI